MAYVQFGADAGGGSGWTAVTPLIADPGADSLPELTDELKAALRERAEAALTNQGHDLDEVHRAVTADSVTWTFAGGHWNLVAPSDLSKGFPGFRERSCVVSTHGVWRHGGYSVHVDYGNPTVFPYVPGALVHVFVDVVYGTIARPNLDKACLVP